MAKQNRDQTNHGYVAFVTTGDEGCIPAGHGDVPGLVVHPDAGAVNLWGIAESRLLTLEKMLTMFASASGSNGEHSMAEFAEVMQPRVQEILTLASTANERASLKRFTDRVIAKSMQ